MQVAAFCWTKIHPADAALGDPELGEIYVVAVDPAFQKQSLGVEITLAGLQWLSDRGVATGMLYVEHDNAAALRTYARVGFDEHHVDRACAPSTCFIRASFLFQMCLRRYRSPE